MKRSSIVWQFALLAVIGCSAQSDPVATTPVPTDAAVQSTDTVPGEGAEAMTFVSLKVPNMI
ncbi:MAG: hypothetical protein HKN47_27055 [Pirellulaceae bacterium]|nr:hypothetical protein [Pirellulaceae bacterium]